MTRKNFVAKRNRSFEYLSARFLNDVIKHCLKNSFFVTQDITRNKAANNFILFDT